MKPTSDMILQMMVDAAEEYGLGWCEETPYNAGHGDNVCYSERATSCCAIGALALAVDPAAMMAGADAYTVAGDYLESIGLNNKDMYKGNDSNWDTNASESYVIGAAFRDAMGGSE